MRGFHETPMMPGGTYAVSSRADASSGADIAFYSRAGRDGRLLHIGNISYLIFINCSMINSISIPK